MKDSHSFFKALISNSPSHVNCKLLPTINEHFCSVNYGYLKVPDSDRFLDSRLDTLPSLLNQMLSKNQKKKSVKFTIPSLKKIAQLFENFNEVEE